MSSLSLRRSFSNFSIDEIKDASNGFGESKLLGKGGEGKVYLTEVCIEGKNTLVAVKHLFPTSNGLEKEIQTVPKIQHPHIVPLYGYCNQSGQNILVYEFMKNGSLYDYVRNNRRVCLSWPQRLKICLDAARGLQHLHTPTEEFPKGIIHRDIKPENILLDENLVAKVSDFGMSKLSHSGQTISSMATNLKGTRGYYAPEYLKFGHVTRRIDVYAFGVVLFQVLCRKMPWDRDGESYYRKDDEDLGLWAQKNVDIEIKGEISPKSLNALTDTINRSLRRKPDERPTMDDVVRNLEKALTCQDPGMNVLAPKNLPSDLRNMIARSINSSSLPHFSSTKEVYLYLIYHPLIIDGGTKSFSLDKRSGKKCYMLAPRNLGITWGDTPKYWTWISLPKARFEELAVLKYVWWFDVYGRISTCLLSPNTNYAAYLVYMLTSNTSGFDFTDPYGRLIPAEASFGVIGAKSETRFVVMQPNGTNASPRKIYNGIGSSSVEAIDANITYPKKRKDGWLEVELGEFYNKGEENLELNTSLREVKALDKKRGLVVQGIEIRPN